jgi:prepilin-type N-terminal cleavage/methylation domain-containing protein
MIREKPFKSLSMPNKRGITLIELLVVLVISGIVIGGLYRVFIAQTKAYTVQDQVVEVQQDIRSAMEIVARDLRMAGFQKSTFNSPLITNSPIVVYPLSDSTITVNYEYLGGASPATYTVTHTVAGGSLTRTLTQTPAVGPPVTTTETLLENVLENVNAPPFRYGISQNGNGVMDDINGDGRIDEEDFVAAASVGTARVVAVRVALTARPAPVNPDVTAIVSPRTLTSVVTSRNMCFRKSQGY